MCIGEDLPSSMQTKATLMVTYLENTVFMNWAEVCALAEQLDEVKYTRYGQSTMLLFGMNLF